MLWSQAPIGKLTRCKGVRKENGLWKPGATRAPHQPLRLSHSRVPGGLQPAGGCWVCDTWGEFQGFPGTQESGRTSWRRGSSSWFLKNEHDCELKAF